MPGQVPGVDSYFSTWWVTSTEECAPLKSPHTHQPKPHGSSGARFRRCVPGRAGLATPPPAASDSGPIVPAHAPNLSFQNPVELYVLSSLRRLHAVPLKNMRSAIAYLRETAPTDHPLADCDLLTTRSDLFVEQSGKHLNISRAGQFEMKAHLLRCIEAGRQRGRRTSGQTAASGPEERNNRGGGSRSRDQVRTATNPGHRHPHGDHLPTQARRRNSRAARRGIRATRGRSNQSDQLRGIEPRCVTPPTIYVGDQAAIDACSLPLMGIENTHPVRALSLAMPDAHYPSWGSKTGIEIDTSFVVPITSLPLMGIENAGGGLPAHPAARPHYPSWGSKTTTLRRPRQAAVRAHYPSWGSKTPARLVNYGSSASAHYPSWGSKTMDKDPGILQTSTSLPLMGIENRPIQCTGGGSVYRLITPHGDRKRGCRSRRSSCEKNSSLPLMGIENPTP